MESITVITDGKTFGSFIEAEQSALQNFRDWFPLADPRKGIYRIDHGDGSGFLQAGYDTPKGPFVTEVEFRDFRPIKRIEYPEAASEMMLVR